MRALRLSEMLTSASCQISHVLPENWTHTLWNQANDRVMPQYA